MVLLLKLYILFHFGHELELVARHSILFVYSDGIEHALYMQNEQTHLAKDHALKVERMSVYEHQLRVELFHCYVRYVFLP